MKKILKSRLFFFILGALIMGSCTVFAYSYIASDVGFTPTDEDWNVENTQDALDYLRRVQTEGGTLVKTVTGGSQNYTMLYDGYILGRMRAIYRSAGAMIFFNETNDDNYNAVVALAEWDLDNYFPVSLYAPKGTLVHTRNFGTYELYIYEWR